MSAEPNFTSAELRELGLPTYAELNTELGRLRAIVKEFTEESIIGRSEEFDHGYHYAQTDLLNSLAREEDAPE